MLAALQSALIGQHFTTTCLTSMGAFVQRMTGASWCRSQFCVQLMNLCMHENHAHAVFSTTACLVPATVVPTSLDKC